MRPADVTLYHDHRATCIRHATPCPMPARRQRIAGAGYPFDGTLYVKFMPTREVVDQWFDAARTAVTGVIEKVSTAIGEWIVKEQTTVGDWIGITVLSGAILGGIGWLLREWKRKKESEREYRNQVGYLAGMVAEFRKHVPAEDMTTAMALRRKALYDSLKLRFEEALEGRADRLSFDEKLSLRLPIETADVDFQLPFVDTEIAKRQFEALRKLFKDFDKIDWLKEYSQEPSVLKRVWGRLWGKSLMI